jgi:hypothetical protein
MMTNKKLIILGAVAVIMIILTVIQSYLSNRPVQSRTLDSHLIQGLDTAAIDKISLGSPDNMITLKKEDKQFHLVDKDNYPASTQKINNLITSVFEIRVNELVTDNPENFKDLDLTDETAKSIIKFLDNEHKLITEILIGKRDVAAKGDYVRLISMDGETDEKAFLSLDVPRLDLDAIDYLDNQFFKTEKKAISKVTVSGPEGMYTISSGDDDKITLKNIPKGKKVKGTVYEDVFTAVTDLTFNDVIKESKLTDKLAFNTTYTCFLKDSGVYTFRLAEQDDKTYVKGASDYTDKSPVRVKTDGGESNEELKEKEAKLLVREASLEFNKMHSGWVYQIPNWKAANMTKKLSDLLEDK